MTTLFAVSFSFILGCGSADPLSGITGADAQQHDTFGDERLNYRIASAAVERTTATRVAIEQPLRTDVAIAQAQQARAIHSEAVAKALIGSWRSTDIGQFGKVAVSINQILTFSKDKKVKATAITTYKGTASNAHCQETTEATGLYAITGSPGAERLVFTYTEGKTTRVECRNATYNATERPLTDDELRRNNPTTGKIVMSGTTFSLTNTINGLQATYTFQKR